MLSKNDTIDNVRSLNDMTESKSNVLPPTPEEVEVVRQELFSKLEAAEKQPLYEKRSAEEDFAEKRVQLEELLNARV